MKNEYDFSKGGLFCKICFFLKRWYIGSMKIKTSLTLSEELISVIDNKSVGYKSRSDFIEKALWTYLNYLIRQERNKLDLMIINKNSDSLNKEALDVLDYQVST